MAAFAVAVGAASAALAAAGAGRAAVERVPKAVKAGFKLGFGCAVVSSQCPTALFRGGKAALAAAAAADAGWAPAFDAARRSAEAGLGGAPQVARLAWAAAHPYLWDWDVVVVAAIVAVGTLRGKRLLPKAAPPGVEVLALVGLATVFSARGYYEGGVVGAPPAGAADAPFWATAVKPWALPFDELVALCFGGSYAAGVRNLSVSARRSPRLG